MYKALTLVFFVVCMMALMHFTEAKPIETNKMPLPSGKLGEMWKEWIKKHGNIIKIQ